MPIGSHRASDRQSQAGQGNRWTSGGRTHAISLYLPREPIDEQRVTKEKDRACRARSIARARLADGRTIQIGSARLLFGDRSEVGRGDDEDSGFKPVAGLSYELKGATDKGAPVIVDFAEIESLVVEKSDKDKAIVRIVTFPAISPAELFGLRPSYTQLRERFTKAVTMSVALRNPEGKLLLIAEVIGSKTRTPKMRARAAFSEIGEAEFRWGGSNLWWSIPSVTADSKYPYRAELKK